MAKPERCLRCGGKIRLQCRKGTDFCSTNCAERRNEKRSEHEFAIAA